MALTAKRVEKLKPPGRYGDGQGLYLQINATGAKSWLLRYERGGRERMMGLGPLHTFSLKEARERARAARQQLIDGIDPLEAQQAAKAQRALAAAKALTFAQAADAYFAQHEKKWRNAKHAAQFLATLKQYALPTIGALPVSEIDVGLVLKVLEKPVEAARGYPAGPLWSARPETANRLRGRIEAVLDWATVRGHRTGDNPARWKGHLAEVLPARGAVAQVQHHPALPYAQIGEFLAELRTRAGVAARALEFTILTAARTGEVVGARWPEVNWKERLWTIPAGRMKGGREQRVPLSPRALESLNSLPKERGHDFVFIAAQRAGLSNMSMSTVIKRMGRDNVTVHGFRSTFRDWAAEMTDFPNHVIEMALAHAIGDKVEAAYRRGDLVDKRRKLTEAWARYCAAATSNVTSFPVRSV